MIPMSDTDIKLTVSLELLTAMIFRTAQVDNEATAREMAVELAAIVTAYQSLLAELTSFISTDVCPVCDRDFSEEGKGPLSDHINHKVRALTGSAERLLGLSRNRSTQQELIDRLERENAEIQSRSLTQMEAIDLDRAAGALDELIAEWERLAAAMTDGAAFAAAETAARRALSEYQSRNLTRTAAMVSLAEFASSLGQTPPGPLDTAPEVVTRLVTVIDDRTHALNLRMIARSRARDALGQAKVELSRCKDADEQIAADEVNHRRADESLKRAARIRSDAQSIKSKVEAVRSRIIGREFNDRLNRLWRDLFVRLAPNEPYVPAFRVPTEPTYRLQPTLITTHRSGAAGGTPGAMLSAGNLNTAALTLHRPAFDSERPASLAHPGRSCPVHGRCPHRAFRGAPAYVVETASAADCYRCSRPAALRVSQARTESGLPRR
jgi:exonuclease SbcC